MSKFVEAGGAEELKPLFYSFQGQDEVWNWIYGSVCSIKLLTFHFWAYEQWVKIPAEWQVRLPRMKPFAFKHKYFIHTEKNALIISVQLVNLHTHKKNPFNNHPDEEIEHSCIQKTSWL